MYGYSEAIGGGNTDGFGFDYEGLVWTIWIMNTVITLIIFLNLLVSIMGDTFDRIQETLENNKFKELCSIMSENEHLFPWGLIFGDAKYIIIIEEEKAEETEENWEGKMKLLRNFMEKSADQ